MRAKLLLIMIVILAAVLRFWQLPQLPPSLNWDEVSIGYNAASILRTGRDEWGEFMPLTFRIYGDYKLPAYIYLTVPFVALFGLNEWAVRLPSAILGVALVWLIFSLVKQWSEEKTALWAAFVAAVLPWPIILSRIALEAQLSLFLTTLGVYFFVRGVKSKYFLVFSAITFGLTIFSYNSSRIIIPLLVLSLGLIHYPQLAKYKKITVMSLVIFLTFFALALPKALLQDSSARYKWTTILDQGAINQINELRGSSALPPPAVTLVYNKVTYFIPQVIQNYFSHFHPNFLFLNGGSNFQFSIPGIGLVYPLLLPFLIYGVFLFLKERKKWQWITLMWLFFSFIPAAVTRDAPHALRSLTATVPLAFISAYAVAGLANQASRFKIGLNLIIIAGLLISLVLFWQNYSGSYRKNYSWAWQYGYKEAVEFIKKEGSNYHKIYLTKAYGEPHEFLLFYLPYDPAKYLSDPNLIRYFRSDWYWVDRFSKYYFLNDWEVKQKANCKETERCLLITSPTNFDQGKLLQQIKFLNGDPAFDIVEL
ncbi:MAG: glycosyltransferase family 39 protein [Candidatus Daviesbacteria bacterium]|nr:MAG: glycosyltransferase family 39 protein [Candidatus Daviesbacteria bacterium]